MFPCGAVGAPASLPARTSLPETHRQGRRSLGAMLALLCSFAVAFAAEKPTLDHLYPAGGCRGTTNEITLLGKFEPWPPKAWASIAGLEFQFTTNKGKAQLTIPADAAVGPGLVRIYNDEGPSDLRIF